MPKAGEVLHAIEGDTAAGPDLVALARALYRQRRARNRYFPHSLFVEPMWDILLDLYIGERERRKTSVKSACIAGRCL